MTDTELLSACLAAWCKCADANAWPSSCDAIMVADFKGQKFFWPQLDGESFSIVRLSDSTVVTDRDLPGSLIESLTWREVRMGAPTTVPLLGQKVLRGASAYGDETTLSLR